MLSPEGLTLSVGCTSLFILIIIGVIVYSVSKPNEEENFERIKSLEKPKPKIKPPSPPEKNRCVNFKNQEVMCGSGTLIKTYEDEPESDQYPRKIELHNQSALRLDFLYIPPCKSQFGYPSSQKFLIGSVPPNKMMFAYRAEGDRKFEHNGKIYARAIINGKEKYPFQVHVLKTPKNVIFFGANFSYTDESKNVVNLISEINYVKLRNHSLLCYEVFYYDRKLGELDAYNITDENPGFLRANQGLTGFRLNSYLTLVVKGTNKFTKVLMNNRQMNAMDVGAVLDYSEAHLDAPINRNQEAGQPPLI